LEKNLYSDNAQRLHTLLREELVEKYTKSCSILETKDRAFDERFYAMRALLQMVAEDNYYCKISGGGVQPWLKYENLIYLLSEFGVLLNEVPYSAKMRHTINELLIVLSRLLDNFVEGCIPNTPIKKRQLEQLSTRKQSSLRADLEKLLGICASFDDREVCYRIAVCVDTIAQLSKDSLPQNAVTESSNVVAPAGEGQGGTSVDLVSLPLQFGISTTCLAPVTVIDVVSIVETLHRAFDTEEVPNWYRLTRDLYQALVLRLMAKGDCRGRLLREAQLIFNKSIDFLRRANHAYYLSHILVDALHVVMRETRSMQIKFWCQDSIRLLYACAASGQFDHKLKLTSWDELIQDAKEKLGSEKTSTLFQKGQASLFRSSNFKHKRIRKGKRRGGSAIDLHNARVGNMLRGSSAAASSSSAMDTLESAFNTTSNKAGALLKIPSIILHIVSRLVQFSIDRRELSFPHIQFVEWFMVSYLGLSVSEGHVLEFNNDLELALHQSKSVGLHINASRRGDVALSKSRSVGEGLEEGNSSSTASRSRAKRQTGHSATMLLQALRDEASINDMPSQVVLSTDYKISKRYSRSLLTRSRSEGDRLDEAHDRFMQAFPRSRTPRNKPASSVILPDPVDQDSDDTIPSHAGATPSPL
jgi:hypothetical protein